MSGDVTERGKAQEHRQRKGVGKSRHTGGEQIQGHAAARELPVVEGKGDEGVLIVGQSVRLFIG